MEERDEVKRLISAVALDNLGIAKELERKLINLRATLIGTGVAATLDEEEGPHSLRENEEATNSVLKDCLETLTQIENNM